MKIVKLFGCAAVLLSSFALAGCDGGGGDAPATMTNQSELERFLAENPDIEADVDTGEETYDEE